jgi:hypothetical protein
MLEQILIGEVMQLRRDLLYARTRNLAFCWPPKAR